MTKNTLENQGLSDTENNQVSPLSETKESLMVSTKEKVKEELGKQLKEKIPFYELLLDIHSGDTKKLEEIPILGTIFKLLAPLRGMIKFFVTGDKSEMFNHEKKKTNEVNSMDAASLDKIKGTDYFMPLVSVPEAKEGGYPADSGLDISTPVGTPAHSIGNGKIIYSEKGHTPWQANDKHPNDTGNSVLIELDEPLKKHGKVVTAPDGKPVKYLWYTHLSELAFHVKEGSQPQTVKAGELVGKSGVGNDSPHLHFALLSHPSQRNGTFVKMAHIREFLNLVPNQAIVGSNDTSS